MSGKKWSQNDEAYGEIDPQVPLLMTKSHLRATFFDLIPYLYFGGEICSL